MRNDFKFWSLEPGKKTFDAEALHFFLYENGFGTYKSDQFEGTLLVKQEGRKIKIVNPKEIRKYCWKYIEHEYKFGDPEERKLIKNEFHNNKSLFHKENLELMRHIEINEIKDDEKTSYLFFINCILKITADGMTKLSYNDIEGHVFERDIIHFELTIGNQELEDYDGEDVEGEFLTFIKCICSDDDTNTSFDNIISLKTIIGYLLHRHKNPSFTKAVILMDDYKGGGPNGGTGKTLLATALAKVRSAAIEDGKYFKIKEKFTLSSVTFDTRLLIIDDLPKTFDFEKLFPLITGSARVERKWENKIKLPFEVSPKLLLTSNYPFARTEESFKRRKIDFVVTKYFNSNNTPEMEFGHLLFTQWTPKDWEDFYLFMADCICHYLNSGIEEQEINIPERTLKMEAHPKFLDYAKSHFTAGVKYNKKDVYNKYYEDNPGVSIVEMTTFRLWLKLYGDSKRYKFIESHSGNDNFFQYSLE
jgi:hypothetical protein